MEKFMKIVMLIVGALFGIVDGSVLAADAAAGAAAVNATATKQANASVGSQGQGVHIHQDVNYGATTDEVRKAEPDFIVDPVDREVVKMYSSDVPIDQVMRHMPQNRIKGMRYGFYNVDERPIKSAITANVTATTNAAVTISVADGGIFSVTDTIFIPTVAGYDETGAQKAGLGLMMFVQKVSGNTLTCFAINKDTTSGTYKCPNIKAGTSQKPVYAYRLGRAAFEGDVTTDVFNIVPTKEERFMQIFKAQVAASSIMQESDKEANWEYNDIKQFAMRDLRKSIELSYLFGVKGYSYDKESKKFVYTCAGILQQIAEGGLTQDYDPTKLETADGERYLLERMVHPIFKGNSGSATRLLFAGSDFIAKVATIPNVSKQMDVTKTERTFGINWSTIKFLTWQLNLVQHPLLDEVGMSKCAFVLDPAYLRKNSFRPLVIDELDLKSSGQYDGNSAVMTEISSPELRYPKTHAFLYTTDQWNPTINSNS